jgi:hypothetical protein
MAFILAHDAWYVLVHLLNSSVGNLCAGWFLLLSSIIGFWRVKRWESSIRASSTSNAPIDVERDIAIRRNIEQVFGTGYEEEDRHQETRGIRGTDGGRSIAVPDRATLEAERLTRDLRDAGLL